MPQVNSWDLEFKWNNQTEKYVYDISGNTEDGILKVKNELAQTDISIMKKDSKSEKAVPGTKFGFYSKDNIYDRNGNVIVGAGEKIATVVTDENGVAKVPFSVPLMSEGYVKGSVAGEMTTTGNDVMAEETTVSGENVERPTEAVIDETTSKADDNEEGAEIVEGVNAGLNSGDYLSLIHI